MKRSLKCAWAALPLSGRCFTRYKKEELFQEVITSSSSPLGISEAAFSGNSYYLSQLRTFRSREGSFRTRSQGSSSSVSVDLSPSIKTGDILLDFREAVPSFGQNKRCVDVSGVATSYYDASVRCPHAKATLPELMKTMHWHDGSSVPELSRGRIPIGNILVFAAAKDTLFAPSSTLKSVLSPSISNGLTSSALLNPGPARPSLQMYFIKNGSSFFCEKRSLVYHSVEEGLDFVEVIAERCRLVASKCVLQPIFCKRGPPVCSEISRARNKIPYPKTKRGESTQIQSFVIKMIGSPRSI